MNKAEITNILRNIIGILLVIYISKIGMQLIEPSGIIGITYKYLKEDYPQIIAIKENSPVSKTDIAINDLIILIDNEDIKNKPIRYISSKLRGEPNTNVSVHIKSDKGIKEYNFTRIKQKIDWNIL